MKILITMFGWNDSGGGTIYPRQLALALQAQGHEVMVLYAAVPPIPSHPPYTLREHEEQGVKLVGIHNRPALFLDDQNPQREIQDSQIVGIVRHYLDQFQPQIVHYHNLLGLSAGMLEEVYQRGIPSLFTLHNFWVLCPTLYLLLPDLGLCQGVNASGSNCLQCTGARLPGQAYVTRRDEIRRLTTTYIDRLLLGAPSTYDMLCAQGYPPEKLEVLRLRNAQALSLWQEVGQPRAPFQGPHVRVGFVGSVIPLKGVEILIDAAQALHGDISFHIYGEVSPQYQQYLSQRDQARRVQFHGPFHDQQRAGILQALDLAVVPSLCYEQAGLVIGEFQAAGLPVLVANLGGLPYYLQPNTGATFERETADLVHQLQAVLDDPTQLQRWQQAIQAPKGFEVYVSAMEERYQTLLAQDADTRQARRHTYALAQRKPGPARWLTPDTDQWHTAPQPGGILDLRCTQPEDLAQLPLAQAGKIWAQSPAQLEQLTALGHSAMLKPLPLPTPHPGPNFALETSSPQQILLPLGPDTHNWQSALAQFISAQLPNTGLILWPLGLDLEAVYPILEAWLAQQDIPESALPEFTLVDPTELEHHPGSILRQVHATWMLSPEPWHEAFWLQVLAQGQGELWSQYPVQQYMAALQPMVPASPALSPYRYHIGRLADSVSSA